MKSIAARNMVLLVEVGTMVLLGVSWPVRGETSEDANLSIEPVYATYKQTDEGHSIHISFMIINSGKTEVTIITENFDRGIYDIDKDTNSLKCTLRFREPLKYKDKYTVIPSLDKYCPVTLKGGEAASINYYEEYSKDKTINYKPWKKENLQAENMIITYEVQTSWGSRFGLWEGEIHSVPVKFEKNIAEAGK